MQTLRLNDVKIGGKLEELPESIEDIELDNCELEDLSGLEKCTKIKRVKASENKIKTYDGLLNSKSSITELLLNYNEIADGDLSKFNNAKKIDVGDNQMNYFKSPNVNELNFVGNPLGATNTELSDDLDELKNEAEFPIDLSAVTGELVLNLDESTPTKDKVQKNTMSATQKLNVLKSLAKSPEANVKLTATDMPLPDKDWFRESPIVELKGGGDEVNSKETSAIPAKCKAVVLEKTALTAFTEVPPQLQSVTLKDNKLLQVVALETESNLEEINFEENETLLDVDLGVQPNLKKVELGGQIETLSGETPELKELNVSDSNIEVIDLNNAVKLEKLVASNTKIKSLDASSFESIEVLDLSGNPEFGKDEENSLILPEKSNLTEVNISDTATKTETIGKIITALNESTNETEAPKKFQFKGAEKRPSETDDLFVNLSSAGWDIEPKEPPQDKFEAVEEEEIVEITRQDLFEKKEINLLFKQTSSTLVVGGSEVILEVVEEKTFRFAETVWLENEVGRTKRVFLSSSKYVMVTWFGYSNNSNSIQLKEFGVAELECPPSYIDEQEEGVALGSFGLKVTAETDSSDSASATLTINKFLKFTNSLDKEYIPSENTPLALGHLQQYKFDLSELDVDDAIIFRTYRTDLKESKNIEIELPVEVEDGAVKSAETDGYYGGSIIIGLFLKKLII